MKGITVEYLIDNDDWTEEEFEENQDIKRELFITEKMLIELIRQNTNFEFGYNIESITRITKEGI